MRTLIKKRAVHGLTLIELVVAAVVIGIITMGIFAADYAIRTTQSNSFRSNYLNMKVASVIMEMSQAAKKVTGHRWDGQTGLQYQAEGIYIDDWNNPKAICFRYDEDNNPNSYTGDHWQCFSRPNASYSIYRCEVNESTDVTTAVPCATTNANFLIQPTTATFIFPVREGGSPTGRWDYIQLTINTRFNPSASYDPLTNPQLEMSTLIYPPGLSQ